MLLLLLATVVQLSAEQGAAYTRGIEEIREIDGELREIEQNKTVLTGSSPEAVDEITTLKALYPDLVLANTAGWRAIYRALSTVRKDRAARLLPLANERMRNLRAEACRSATDLQKSRQQFELGEAYRRMTLTERLEWRRAMDADRPETVCAQ